MSCGHRHWLRYLLSCLLILKSMKTHQHAIKLFIPSISLSLVYLISVFLGSPDSTKLNSDFVVLNIGLFAIIFIYLSHRYMPDNIQTSKKKIVYLVLDFLSWTSLLLPIQLFYILLNRKSMADTVFEK